MILVKTKRRFGKIVCKSQVDGEPIRELSLEQFKRLLLSGGDYHLIKPVEHSDDYEKAILMRDEHILDKMK